MERERMIVKMSIDEKQQTLIKKDSLRWQVFFTVPGCPQYRVIVIVDAINREDAETIAKSNLRLAEIREVMPKKKR